MFTPNNTPVRDYMGSKGNFAGAYLFKKDSMRIDHMSQIQRSGDLLALVLESGNEFLAFLTSYNGNRESQILERTGSRSVPKFCLFDANLNPIHTEYKKQEVFSVNVHPEGKRFYGAVVNSKREITNEYWKVSEDGLQISRGDILFKNGVYRITSDDLVSRIIKTFNDSQKER